MDTRKDANVKIRIKMSMMDHFASASSHMNTEPRLDTDTMRVGRNQRASVMTCLLYGHTPLKTASRIANSCEPAVVKGIQKCSARAG